MSGRVLKDACAEGSATLRLQEGAEGVVHAGHVQVLQMAAVRLGSRLLASVALPARAGEGPLSPDGAAGASLQAGQDHVGEVLLEPLEVLPAGNGFRTRHPVSSIPVSEMRADGGISHVVGGVGSL